MALLATSKPAKSSLRSLDVENGEEGDDCVDGRWRLRGRSWASLSSGVTVTAAWSCLSSGHEDSPVLVADDEDDKGFVASTSTWGEALLQWGCMDLLFLARHSLVVVAFDASGQTDYGEGIAVSHRPGEKAHARLHHVHTSQVCSWKNCIYRSDDQKRATAHPPVPKYLLV